MSKQNIVGVFAEKFEKFGGFYLLEIFQVDLLIQKLKQDQMSY